MFKKLINNKPLLVMVSLILVIVLILGGTGIYTLIPDDEKESNGLKFDTFSSCSDIEKYILDNQETDYYYPMYDLSVREEAVDMALPTSADTSKSSNGAGSTSDYSRTNVQVEGVDESDIIKTDGDYIYVVWQNEVYVIQVVSETEQTVISNFEVPGDPFEMFLDGDKLIILSRESSMYTPYRYTNYWPLSTSENGAFIFDISDRKNPELEREIKIEGDFVTARMMDGVIYLVSSKYFYNFAEGSDIKDSITQFSDSKVDEEYRDAANCDEISHFGSNVNSFVNVTAIPVDGGDTKNTLILGDASNIYMSTQNLYLATIVYKYDECDEQEKNNGNILEDITGALTNDSEYYYGDYCYPQVIDVNTDIYKLSVEGNDVNFVASNEINGTLLNQFSMDEYYGYFRVATTANDYAGWNQDSYNNMYILDEDLNQVGKVDKLAEGEQIYSVRFMGNRAYMVTYKAIDPLFVIDLSDVTNPKVLGELKMPGYSDYLHPYDENHLIGIGMSAESISDEWALNQGIKVALFDVTDVKNPVIKSEVVIGDRGSETAVSYSHKAFLFDKEKELMVIPTDINEIPDTVTDVSAYTYGDRVFTGFTVFKINLTDGIIERGRIGRDVSSADSYYYYDYNPRSLYINNNLYTFKDGVLRVNKLDDLSSVNVIDVYTDDDNSPETIKIIDPMIVE